MHPPLPGHLTPVAPTAAPNASNPRRRRTTAVSTTRPTSAPPRGTVGDGTIHSLPTDLLRTIANAGNATTRSRMRATAKSFDDALDVVPHDGPSVARQIDAYVKLMTAYLLSGKRPVKKMSVDSIPSRLLERSALDGALLSSSSLSQCDGIMVLPNYIGDRGIREATEGTIKAQRVFIRDSEDRTTRWAEPLNIREIVYADRLSHGLIDEKTRRRIKKAPADTHAPCTHMAETFQDTDGCWYCDDVEGRVKGRLALASRRAPTHDATAVTKKVQARVEKRVAGAVREFVANKMLRSVAGMPDHVLICNLQFR
jgi:hypothetical protein